MQRPPIVDTLVARGWELVQTHISWVLLGPGEVYKLKKPVDFGFVDFTSLAERRAACEAEVQLNRRLSPDVYIGVVAVTQGPEGPVVGPVAEAGSEPVEYGVHMRRLSDDARADVRLRHGTLTPDHVVAIAERIAAFHDDARADDETARYGTVEVIRGNVEENFAQTSSSLARYLEPDEAAELRDYQLQFLREHDDLLVARVREGRIRDGHGDLRLEHVYLREGEGASAHDLSIIDCIEFNDRFRYGDVAADIAFLAMDFARLGHVELAELCLAAYARTADDFDLYAVVDFYESYRAYVRGKIATFVAEDEDAPSAAREQARGEARRDFRLALSVDRRSLLDPVLVAVGGIIATGKSTIAEAIARERSAPIVDADRTRKAMVGARPTEPIHTDAWAGAYDPGFSAQVYDEVLRRAEVVLRSGRPVIVDASFRSAAFRGEARALAERLGVPFRFVECRADPQVCRARLRKRAESASVSDGRLEIFDDFVAKYEPVTELPAAEHLVLDTERALAESLAEIRHVVATWPRGLVE